DRVRTAGSRSAAACDLRAPRTPARRRPATSSREVLRDELGTSRPAAVVPGEGLRAALERDLIEARFGDAQLRAAFDLAELELDQGHGLLRIVDAGLDRGRMPAEREQPHRLDAVDDEFEHDPLVGLLRLRDLGIDLGRHDPTRHRLADDERPVELDAEPRAE